MNRRHLIRALGAMTCAALVLAMTACGGGGGGSNSFTGNGGSAGGGTGSGSGSSGPPPLVITTTSLPDGIVNDPYRQAVTASGGSPPYRWAADGLFPTGLSLDASGNVTGTPPNSGGMTLGVIVTDSSSPPHTASAGVEIFIEPRLIFVTTTLPNAHINAPYDAVVNVGPIANRASWELVSGSLPPGLQLVNPLAASVEVTGTPTETGSYPITLQVQDLSTTPQVVQQSYTLVVDNSVAIVTRSLGSGLQNSNYSSTVSAINGTPPYQWSAVGLPQGLSIDPNTGTISGVPSIYGLFQPTVTVSDSGGHTDSQTLGLTVIAVLTIPNYGNQSAVVNKDFSDYLFAFGGVPPYTWSIVSGTLPPGLALDGVRGNISGIPTQLGSYSVTLKASDTGPPQQTAQWSTTFSVVPPQLYISGTLPPKLPLGVPFQWSPSAQGGTPPYHWGPATGMLPPGLSFDPNTGDLTGTPTTVGQYTFVLSATDSGNPPQTVSSSYFANVTTPLGRNDVIAHATPVGDGNWPASISPYADPPDSPNPMPDTDYYKIIGSAGNIVKIWTVAQSVSWTNPLDTVLEIVDVNGVQLNTCRQPGDQSAKFNSTCLNDDIVKGINRDSQLEVMVPGQTNSETTMYAHVIDWRGDARPDMQYSLGVSGSVPPLSVSPPNAVTYGAGYSATSACPIAQLCAAQFTSTGGTAPITWAVGSGVIPPGMTVDPATGGLSGTPTTSGSYTMVVRITDSAMPAQVATAAYTLTIEDPPKITTAALPDGLSGQPYNQKMGVSGGIPPYRWYLSASWDPGLQFDSNTGTVSGIPTKTNTYDLSIGVLDSLGLGEFNRHVLLTINAGPYSFVGGSFPDAKVGVLYANYCPQPRGGTTPYTFILASGSLPPGLALGNNGPLFGTPTAAGTYTFMLTATDSSPTPQAATAIVAITVMP